VAVSEEDINPARGLIPDPATSTLQLIRAGTGVVFLLPWPVQIGKDQAVEHVAIAHAASGVPVQGITPPILFRDSLLIYAAGNEHGILCGFINAMQQPTIGAIRLKPGFSWHDMADDWRTRLEDDELRPDANLLALALALCFVCHNRLNT
jgi:hypothetical protein